MLAALADAVQLSWDLLADLQQLFAFHFMQNAYLAGTLVALAAGAMGHFMVLRSQSFAGHTLAKVGFSGAMGAALIGVSPVLGLVAFGLGAALLIGMLSARETKGQDVAVGLVLAFSLGLGLLFVQLSHFNNTTGVYSLLFGSIVGVRDGDLGPIALTTVATLATLVVIGRPLLFASLDPEVAAARGVPVRLLAALFLFLLAFAVAEAVQIVGALLIFALLVTPAAIAQQLTARPALSILLATALALLFTWFGLALGYFFSPYPIGFFITSLAFGTYALVRLARIVSVWLMRRQRQMQKERLA
ncbi:MAG TPA: metal ABC transporter permease [Ktedonobacterales bacterium]|nr:metal ABC transporter permease [Ktedonobacterales bacterium]